MNYHIDHLVGETYSIVTDDGTPVLTLSRTSRRQAEAVRDAMQAIAGWSDAFQEGYDHGRAVGYHEGSEETCDAAYEQGRADYHAELWERATESELPETTEILDMARDFLTERAFSVLDN